MSRSAKPNAWRVNSYRDVSSLDDTVRRSSHSMLAFVLVIVGQPAAPDGLHVSIFHGEGASVVLKPDLPIAVSASPWSPARLRR
jgi:hypothetical protein